MNGVAKAMLQAYILVQGSVNECPWAKSSHTYLLTYCLELFSHSKDHIAHQAKNIHCLVLYRKCLLTLDFSSSVLSVVHELLRSLGVLFSQ